MTKFGSVLTEILPGVFARVEAAEASHPCLSRSAGRSHWRGFQAFPLSMWLMKEAKKADLQRQCNGGGAMSNIWPLINSVYDK